jgi:hypothetical protein
MNGRTDRLDCLETTAKIVQIDEKMRGRGRAGLLELASTGISDIYI